MADQSHYRITAELNGLEVPVTQFTLHERLSEPFTGQLDFYDTGFNLEPVTFAGLLGKYALVTLWDGDKPVRYVNGIVHQLEAGAAGTRRRYFTATLVPRLSNLKLTHDCRIFQNLTVQKIVTQLLNEHGILFHNFALQKRRVEHAYCVQYNESVFDFIHRLLAEEGIFYYFEHTPDYHKLCFRDNVEQFDKLTPRHYQDRSANKTEPCIWSVSYAEQQVTSQTTQRDRTFHNPNYNLEHTHHGLYLDHQRKFPNYRYNGRYKRDEQGKPFTQYYQQQLQNAQRLATFEHDYLPVKEGQRFNLENHPDETRNRQWVVVANQLHVAQPQASHEEAQANYNSGVPIPIQYASQVTLTTQAMPYPQPFSPPAWPKPVVDGPQVADVVGPPNEEIFCDDYGRVAVQFPWDRYAKGDPDQPIITGRTYNANNLPPYKLAQHKTRMTIKSKTHRGKGYNELRFEDENNKQQVYLHGQKDYDIIMENDRKEWIRHDRHLRVDNDKYEQVHQDSHQTIGQDKSDRIERHRYFYSGGNFIWRVMGQVHRWIGEGLQLFVGASRATEIAASDELVIGANQRTAVGNESYTRANSIVLEASQELTIKVPGGFIKIDSGGIYIKGNFVKLNSGGSPGAGTAPKPPAPEEPQVPTIPEDADHRGER